MHHSIRAPTPEACINCILAIAPSQQCLLQPETKTGNFVAMKGSTAHAPVSSGSDPVRTEASPKGYPTKGGKASKQASVRTMKSRAGLEVEYSKET
eukprot:scaffold163146_cov14-Tisochrysis_lutea.AAC.1